MTQTSMHRHWHKRLAGSRTIAKASMSIQRCAAPIDRGSRSWWARVVPAATFAVLALTLSTAARADWNAPSPYGNQPSLYLACQRILDDDRPIFDRLVAVKLIPAVSGATTLWADCYLQEAPAYGGDIFTSLTFTSCSGGQVASHKSKTGCVSVAPLPKEHGNTCPWQPHVGDPINALTGNVFEHLVDYRSADGRLRFERYYNSDSTRITMMGIAWRNNFSRSLEIFTSGGGSTIDYVYVWRSDGQRLYFDQVSGSFVPDADTPYKLTHDTVAHTWSLTDLNNAVETYNDSGRLASILEIDGYQQDLTYDGSGQLTMVEDSYGRQFDITWSGGLVSTVAVPDGGVYTYEYSSGSYELLGGGALGAVGGNVLKRVRYPALQPGAPRPTVTFLYENADYPYALTGMLDENGDRYATWNYDSSGRAISSEHAGGADLTTITYNVDGTRTVTNPLGKDAIYSFTTIAGLSRVTEIEGQASASCAAANSSYTYDSNGFVVSSTDWLGNVTNYTRDSRGLETSRTEAVSTAEEHTIDTVWDSTTRLPTQIVEPGRTIDLTYDTAGRLIERTETDTTTGSTPYSTNGQTRGWTYTYTTAGQLETVDGPRIDVTEVTEFDYDTAGNLTTVTNALSQVTTLGGHDGSGRPTVVTDPNGVATDLAYDSHGRLVSRTVEDAVGGDSVMLFAYDVAGQLIEITMPDGGRLAYEYDAAHRLTAVENELGERIEYTLDAMGNRTGEDVKAPGGSITKTQSRVFDELGRLLQSIGADIQTWAYEYDVNGNTTSITDPRTNETTQAFDALDRLIEVVAPGTLITTYGYDAQDRLTEVTDARGLVTHYTYDGLGNLIQLESPDTGTTVFYYDEAGNRIQQTDARSIVTEYGYDALNRIMSKTFPAASSEDVTYSYDDPTTGRHAIGRLDAITDGSGSTEYSYDPRGNVTEEVRTIDGVAYTTAYGYDLADRVVGITYPSGRVVTYWRDKFGRVTAVFTQSSGTAALKTLASDIAYAPFGPMISLRDANGILATLVYDQDYQLTALSTAGGSTDVQDLAYDHDPNGNITDITDALDGSRTQSFDYDALDRLTDAAGLYGTLVYDYDEVGNRLSQSITQGTTTTETYSYDTASNRLDSVTVGSLTRSFTYAANGNVTVDDLGGSAVNLDYSADNRLASLSQSSTTLATYDYNALGERVAKDVGGTVTHYHFDRDGRLIEETDDTGTLLREYVTLDGLPLAVIEPGSGGGSPSEIVIDNTDSGASATSGWATATSLTGYLGSNYLARAGGTGADTATWTPSLPATGPYQVYARWPADADYGSAATYSVVHDGGTTDITVDQRLDSGTWQSLGLFQMTPGVGRKVTLSDAAGPGPSKVITIDNLDPSTSRTGTWTTSSGLPGNYAADWVYTNTINNTFTWPLDVPFAGTYKVYARWITSASGNSATSLEYAVTHAGGTTTVTANQKQSSIQWVYLGSFALTPGSGHKVVVKLTSTGFINADAVRAVLDLGPSGGDEVLLDNGATGTSSTGTWTASSYTGAGPFRGGDFRYNDSGGTYTWTPTIPASGWYKVYARWTSGSDRPTAAQYTVHHQGGSTAVSINQRLTGGEWASLGVYQMVPSSSHRVVLSDSAPTRRLVADAIRLVRLLGQTPDDVVVDDTDSGATSTGSWSSSTYAGLGIFWGSDFAYNDQGGGFAWTPTLAQAGRYRVYARWTAGFDRPTDALYTIFHTGGSTTVPVDQRGSGVQWVYLGSYDLAPSSSHRVELSDGSPSRRLVADAVLFEWEGNAATVVADAVKFVPAPAADALYVHSDHLGAPQAMTDLGLSVVWRLDVRPFGETAALAGSASNNQRFPGQHADAESGYSYNYFRDYEPALGRYLESDPIGLAGGVNTYAYVSGDPVSNVDLDGLDTIEIRYNAYPVETSAGRLPLGHGGAIAVDPITGRTKYYEYGRYDLEEHGIVRSGPIPDLTIGPDGLPTQASLDNLYDTLSERYGRGASISATYRPEYSYQGLIDYAERYMRDPNRPQYSIWSNNCFTFAHDAATSCKEGEMCDRRSNP